MEIDWIREAIALVGSLLLLLGSFLLGSKRRVGWVALFAGNATWTAYGIYDLAWVIIVETIVFQGVAVRGWLRWGRDAGNVSELRG